MKNKLKKKLSLIRMKYLRAHLHLKFSVYLSVNIACAFSLYSGNYYSFLFLFEITLKMLQKFLFRSFFCCISLEKGCSLIGAFEWIYTVYLSCRYYDLSNMGCRGLKISCSQIYYNVISFIISAAIVSGIMKKSRAYFIPWLIIKFIEYAVYSGIMAYEVQESVSEKMDLVFPITFTAITFFVFWYSWLCVLSLYFKMGHGINSEDQEDSQFQELA